MFDLVVEEHSTDDRMEDACERLACLLRQEELCYTCPDYLCPDWKLQQRVVRSRSLVLECASIVTDARLVQEEASLFSQATLSKSPSSVCIQDFHNSPDTAIEIRKRHVGMALWREQMFQWACTVVDTFGIDREIVLVAFNILDRYVAKETKSSHLPILREDFQLFSMVSLFIAVKIFESTCRISVRALEEMSRGFYPEAIICETEQDMLESLDWRVNPPSPMAYCRLLLEMLPGSTTVSNQFQTTCQNLSEMAVSDACFLKAKASHVGLSAFLLSASRDQIPGSVMHHVLQSVQPFISTTDKEFDECYHRLESLYWS
jgi:lipoyl(octanoyl) transferase